MAYRSIADEFEYGVQLMLAQSFKAALTDVNNQLDKELQKKFKKITQKTQKGLNLRPYQLEANQAIVDQMRTAVVERFDEEREHHQQFRNPEPYGRTRKSPRGADALRAALKGPATAVARHDGIGFINSTLLYEAAAFWRRLNFGSGTGTVGLPPLEFTVFGEHFTLAPTPMKRGAPNTMPPGLWFADPSSRVIVSGQSSTDVFAPIQRMGTTHRPVKQISPWGFLNAGIERFNQIAGVEYSKMLSKIVEEKLKRGLLD